MIKVSGDAKLRIDFEFEINMTEEQWDNLPEHERHEIIDDLIGGNEMETAELDDCDIWDVESLDEGDDSDG